MKQSRIYAYFTASTCPVEATKTFLSKLPDCCQSLFYQKRKTWEGTWYNTKLPMGINTIGDLMKSILKIHTSRCVRSTAIPTVFNVGAYMTDIQCVSGY